jgi:hypothetical protein
MVQNFKGDETELKMRAVAEPILDMANLALDEFYAEGFDCNPFLLMLYDEKRIPFSNRIDRDPFVLFIKEALARFPFTGTFDVYLFILIAIFGIDSEIYFEVPAPGKLSIDVNAISNLEFEFIGRSFVDGNYQFYTLVDDLGNELLFRGISGIETEYELGLLFSEIMPAGIIPAISLTFFGRYNFIALHSDGNIYDILDSFGNQIIFTEIGD